MKFLLLHCNQVPLLPPTTISGGHLHLSCRNLTPTTLQITTKPKNNTIVAKGLPPTLEESGGITKEESKEESKKESGITKEQSSNGFVEFMGTLLKEALKEATKDLSKDAVKHLGGFPSLLALVLAVGSNELMSSFILCCFLGLVWLILNAKMLQPNKEEELKPKEEEKPKDQEEEPK